MSTTRENPHKPAAVPRESMARAVTREADEKVTPELELELGVSTTLENPNPPPAPPRESMAAAVTVDAPTPAAELEPEPSSAPALPGLKAVPKPLPALPRLRVSYHYTTRSAKRGPELCCELVLMGEKREQVHRESVYLKAGDVLAQVHALLMTVVGTAAVQAGSAAPLPAPSSEPPPAPASEPESEPPPAPASEPESEPPPAPEVLIQNTQPDPTVET